MRVEPGKTYIGKVRFTSQEHNALAFQLRLEGMLAATTLHPHGLPAAAIVCIRTFRDPLPGSLETRGYAIRPPRTWEQAVATSLDRLVQRAARPVRDVVPVNAEAVIFADQAELLACLASDWYQGSAATRWWWQSLFRGGDIAHVIPTAWLDAPAYIPAALQHLSERGKTVAFVRLLTSNEVRTMVQRITDTFALHELQPIIELYTIGAEPVVDTIGELEFGPVGAPLAEVQKRTTEANGYRQGMPLRNIAPWQQWVSESATSGLSLEQHLLLGIGLMLQRAPMVVRTSSFAQAVLQWQRVAQSSSSPTMLNPPITTFSEPNTEYSATEHTANGRLAENSQETPITQTFDPLQVNPSSVGAPLVDTLGPTPESTTLPVAIDSVIDQETPRETSLLEAHIETEFGGVFYLINLGLFLGLYGDFTTPAQPGFPLSIWDFVALLGQQLVSDRSPQDERTPISQSDRKGSHLPYTKDECEPEYSRGDRKSRPVSSGSSSSRQTDPVWALLARLAGRSDQDAPGKDFVPPDSWRVPVEWLASFPETGPWQWSIDGGRLRVKYPEQFLLLDLPLDTGDPVQQLEREMQVYSDQDVRRDPGGHLQGTPLLYMQDEHQSEYSRGDPCGRPGGCSHSDPLRSSNPHPVERWLARLMPYVRARLNRALASSNTDDLPHILCEHHAHIFVTATHLDIVLSLAELPIEIRMAGLDRNPGWVPAAGRFIAFHFE